MKKTKLNRFQMDVLRQKAVDIVDKEDASNQAAFSSKQLKLQLYELRVHQIELEMQNEELRRTQHNLEIAQERYFELYELAPVGYLTLNEQGQIMEANLTSANMLGAGHAELLNQPLSRYILPEDQDIFYLNRKQLSRSGLPEPCEFRIMKPDRTISWSQMKTALVRTVEGHVIAFRCILSDISSLKSSEEALRISQARYLSIIEDQVELICRYLPDGRLSFVNAAYARYYGKNQAELINTNFSPNIPEPDLSMVLNCLAEISPDKPVTCFIHRIINPDGEVRWQRWTQRGIYSTEGILTEYQAVGTDITEHKLAELKLIEAHDELELKVAERTSTLALANEEMKRVSFALIWAEERERERIAGELHDRVGQSLLLAKMKLDGLAEKIPSESLRTSAVEASALLGNSIQDIRSLTFKMRPPILDTTGIETALEWLCSSINNDYDIQVDFTDDCRPKPLSVEVRYSLYQAVRELLLNVVKHAGCDKAQLKLKTDNKTLFVQVIDNGVGISHPDASLKHVNNNSYGLYNVRQRIEQMGGRFEIKSTPGSGTSVTLTVPFSEEER